MRVIQLCLVRAGVELCMKVDLRNRIGHPCYSTFCYCFKAALPFIFFLLIALIAYFFLSLQGCCL